MAGDQDRRRFLPTFRGKKLETGGLQLFLESRSADRIDPGAVANFVTGDFNQGLTGSHNLVLACIDPVFLEDPGLFGRSYPWAVGHEDDGLAHPGEGGEGFGRSFDRIVAEPDDPVKVDQEAVI